MPSVNTEKSRDASSGPTDKSNATTASISTVGAAVSSVCKAVVAELPSVLLRAQFQAGSTRSALAMPNGLRSRTATQYTNERGNKPATFIEVARMPTGGSGNAATAEAIPVKFNDFFITDCQEQDAEKAEVAETFGAPHVFASGRYMRKVSIQGVCRTGPLNPEVVELTTIGGVKLLSDEDYARYLVPQTLGLRVLYDKLLRASELISRGLFARLHVDGEVYSGWFTTLNIARNANEEAFAHFTSSMLVFSRYHKDETWAEKLVPSNLVGKRGALTDTVAAAVLSGMIGKLDLSFKTSTATIKAPIKAGNKDKVDFSTETILTAVGIPQSLTTTYVSNGTPVDGFRLAYTDSNKALIKLDGATLPSNFTEFVIHPLITDYEALRSVALKNGKPDKEYKVSLTVQVTVTPVAGRAATLSVLLTIDTVQDLVLSVVSINSTEGKMYEGKAADIFSSDDNIATLDVSFTATVSGKSPDGLENTLLGAPISIVGPDEAPNTEQIAGNRVTVSSGGQTLSPDDVKLLDSRLASPIVWTSPIDPVSIGLFHTTIGIDYSSLAKAASVTSLKSTSPLAASNILQTDFRLQLRAEGYSTCRSEKLTLKINYETEVRSMLSSTMKVEYAKNGDQFWLTFNLNANASSYKIPRDQVGATVLALVKKSKVSATFSNGYTLDAGSTGALLTANNSVVGTSSVTIKVPAYSFLRALPAVVSAWTTSIQGQDSFDKLLTLTCTFQEKDSAQSPTFTKTN